MPVVRAQRQVGPEPLPGVRLQSAETPESQGAQVAQVKGEQARVVGDIAGMGVRLSVDQVSRMTQEEKRQSDLVAQTADETYFTNLREHIVSDPKDGFVNVTGTDANGLLDTVPKAWIDAEHSYLGTLKDPMRKARAAAFASRQGAAVQGDLDRHVGQQNEKVGVETMQARQESALSLAATQARDPHQALPILAEGIAPYEAWAKQRGVPREVIDQHKAEYFSTGYTTLITRLLSEGNDVSALEAYEEVKAADGFAGKDLAHVTAMVEAGSTAGKGERAAAAIWAEQGPKSDTDPISLDHMEDAARAKFGDDTKGLKATIEALRTRKQAVDDSRKERTEAINTKVWGAVLQNQPWDVIKRMPEVVQDPKLGVQVREHLDNLANQAESRANAAEGRAAARESRAYTAELRQQRQLEIDSMGTYWELSQDPEKLRAMTPGAIMAMAPTLGNTNVSRLLEDHAKVVKNDASFRAAKADRDIFKEVAAGAGFDYVYENPRLLRDTERANLGQLQQAVDEAVGRATLKNGAPLTPDQQRTVAQSVVDQKVVTPGRWFGENQQVAAIVNEKDRPKAYVPVAQIPASNVTQAVRALRPFLAVSEQGLSDEALLAKHRQSIERAYAAHLLGLGADEELRRLKGGQ